MNPYDTMPGVDLTIGLPCVPKGLGIVSPELVARNRILSYVEIGNVEAITKYLDDIKPIYKSFAAQELLVPAVESKSYPMVALIADRCTMVPQINEALKTSLDMAFFSMNDSTMEIFKLIASMAPQEVKDHLLGYYTAEHMNFSKLLQGTWVEVENEESVDPAEPVYNAAEFEMMELAHASLLNNIILLIGSGANPRARTINGDSKNGLTEMLCVSQLAEENLKKRQYDLDGAIIQGLRLKREWESSYPLPAPSEWLYPRADAKSSADTSKPVFS